jgi:DNA-binding IclR family transcriptional regulator
MTTQRVTSVQRTLAVLDCFTAEAVSLTLSEIARRLAQPVSSTHRQVGELIRWGALERDKRGRYRIGLHLWEVGSRAPRSKNLHEASLPFLEDLYEATHENVQVAVLDGREVVYIERVFGHRAIRSGAVPGTRLPLHATAVGRVLLAHSDGDLINEVLGSPLTTFTSHTTVDPHELRRELAHVRRTGYAICDRQMRLVATSVAAPIRGPGGDVVAALSIIISANVESARRFAPAVVAAALGISRALGAAIAGSANTPGGPDSG